MSDVSVPQFHPLVLFHSNEVPLDIKTAIAREEYLYWGVVGGLLNNGEQSSVNL